MMLSFESPEVQSYIACVAICVGKLLLMAPLTIIMRMTRGIFQNPEDVRLFKGVVKYDDNIVERVRRAHLNDLENIPAFVILGALYLTTEPSASVAMWLFRVFTISRIVHTIVYAVFPIPQPTRATAFAVAALINAYMVIQVLIYYITRI